MKYLEKKLGVLLLVVTLAASQLLPSGFLTLKAYADDSTEVEKVEEANEDAAPSGTEETQVDGEEADGENAEEPAENAEVLPDEEKSKEGAEKAPALRVSSLDIIFSNAEMTQKLALKSETVEYDGKEHKLLPEFVNAGSDGRILLTDTNGRKWYGTFHIGGGWQRGLTETNAGNYSWGIAVYLDKLESTSGTLVYNKGTLYGNWFSVRFERPTYGWYDYYPGNVDDPDGQIAGFPKLNLTITPRAISVKLNTVTKVYGEKDPDRSTWATLTSGTLAEGDDLGSLLNLQRKKGEDVGEYPFYVNTSQTGGGEGEVVKKSAGEAAIERAEAKDEKVVAVEAEKEKESDESNMDGPSTETKPETQKIKNYNVTFENKEGKLVITPAPLVITALDNGKMKGTSDPVLEVDVKGLVNGETLPDGFYRHWRDPGEEVGKYPIHLEIDKDVAESTNTSDPDEPGTAIIIVPVEDEEKVVKAGYEEESAWSDIIPGEIIPGDPVDSGSKFKAKNYTITLVPGTFTISDNGTTNDDEDDDPDDSEGAKTGDESDMMELLGLFGLSAAGLYLLARRRREQK